MIYVKVKKYGWRTNPHILSMTTWCREMGIAYERLGLLFLFEDEDNALLFALRWGEELAEFPHT